MFKKIALGLAALVAVVVTAFVAFVASRPAEFTMERSLIIPAPPSTVFALANSCQEYLRWTPWNEPSQQNTFAGPLAGVGNSCEWKGEKNGAGKMTVTDSQANASIQLRLEFLEPMQATNTVTYLFKPEGDATHTTWRMDGTNNFLGKMFSLFFNDMLLAQFDTGLAKWSEVAVAQAKIDEARIAEERVAAEKKAAEEKAAMEAAAAPAATLADPDGKVPMRGK